MKRPEECVDILEIRSAIDSLDKGVVEALATRYKYVLEAAKFKQDPLAVQAPERVKAMLDQRRAWAAEQGISPDLIESLFRSMVTFFVKEELDRWIGTLPAGIATTVDAEEILELQRQAFRIEAELYNDFSIEPLTQTLEELREDIATQTVIKLSYRGKIIGSARGKMVDELSCYIGRVIVHPELQNKGIGQRVMREIEACFPQAGRFHLGTGHLSEKNICFYNKLGYTIYDTKKINDKLSFVLMEKYRTGLPDQLLQHRMDR